MRSEKFLISGSVLALSLLVGCGDFVESDDKVGLATVDTKGGALRFHALEVEVPEGAVAHPVTLRATAATQPGLLSDAFHLEPDGHTFAAHITVTIVLEGAGTPVADVFPADVSHHPAQPLVGRIDDGYRVSGTTSSTGTFALIHCPAGICPL